MRLSQKGLYYYKYSEKKQSLSKVSRLTEEEKIANSKILKRKKQICKESPTIANKKFLKTEQGRHMTRRLFVQRNKYIDTLVNRKYEVIRN